MLGFHCGRCVTQRTADTTVVTRPRIWRISSYFDGVSFQCHAVVAPDVNYHQTLTSQSSLTVLSLICVILNSLFYLMDKSADFIRSVFCPNYFKIFRHTCSTCFCSAILNLSEIEVCEHIIGTVIHKARWRMPVSISLLCASINIKCLTKIATLPAFVTVWPLKGCSPGL